LDFGVFDGETRRTLSQLGFKLSKDKEKRNFCKVDSDEQVQKIGGKGFLREILRSGFANTGLVPIFADSLRQHL
jgi:hypothetical protein